MTKPPRQSELEAYLDEALPSGEMARVEHALRGHPECIEQLAAINARRDAGVHTLGEIWRRHRLSCPTRAQLGSYLMGVLPDDAADHVAFHVKVAGCRRCQASLEDLRQKEAESPEAVEIRRRKYFQSSAGYL
ncbi:MAG TPA: hypothetical protein DD670_03430 [Planctomycetaceae bacterium]|nr:hypothetical protein [Planctomycetaceae bacterium]